MVKAAFALTSSVPVLVTRSTPVSPEFVPTLSDLACAPAVPTRAKLIAFVSIWTLFADVGTFAGFPVVIVEQLAFVLRSIAPAGPGMSTPLKAELRRII